MNHSAPQIKYAFLHLLFNKRAAIVAALLFSILGIMIVTVPYPAYLLQHPASLFHQAYHRVSHVPEILTALSYQYNPFNRIPSSKAVASLTNEDEIALPVQPLVSSISGPLRVSSINPRYFQDAMGRLAYLTGSHTWSNLQDNGGSDPPPVFDYATYLDFLQANNHNFFRLWSWEESRWTTETSDDNYWFSPGPPYKRTGPELALDGKPQFDLNQFEQAYFDRLRVRVQEAGERGIYVAIVLFNGWSVADGRGGFAFNNPWKGHPLNINNNVNGVNGDPDGNDSGTEIHTLEVPAITAIQKTYVRKIIDTVNDLDNVLYEISNESEGDSTDWQYYMINLIKEYESTKPKQHPVGMTVAYPNGDNEILLNSPADWISPNGNLYDPPVANGRKVILLDTDHLCGILGIVNGCGCHLLEAIIRSLWTDTMGLAMA